jgi:hypothetical protein
MTSSIFSLGFHMSGWGWKTTNDVNEEKNKLDEKI